jgi:hypothetical protein
MTRRYPHAGKPTRTQCGYGAGLQLILVPCYLSPLRAMLAQ